MSPKTVLLSSQSLSLHFSPTHESYTTAIPTCSNSVSHPQTLSSFPSTCSENLPRQTYTHKKNIFINKKNIINYFSQPQILVTTTWKYCLIEI